MPAEHGKGVGSRPHIIDKHFHESLIAVGIQGEFAAGHFFEARGQVEFSLAVDLVGKVVRAEALGRGQGSEAGNLGDEGSRSRRGLSGSALGLTLELYPRRATLTAGLNRDCWTKSQTVIKPRVARMQYPANL